MYHVAYKTPHNIFFRHLWRVKSAAETPDTWVFKTAWGRTVRVPKNGTIVAFGRGYTG